MGRSAPVAPAMRPSRGCGDAGTANLSPASPSACHSMSALPPKSPERWQGANPPGTVTAKYTAVDEHERAALRHLRAVS